MFETIRIEVSKHFNPPSAVPRHRQSKQQLRLDYDVIVPDSETEQSTKGGTYQSDLKWQALSAFVFLRFFVPAILHPHLFGLVEGLPPPGVHRTLKLIAKVLQSLANLNLVSVCTPPVLLRSLPTLPYFRLDIRMTTCGVSRTS